MEFKNSIKKWFYSGGTGVSDVAATATHRIPLLDASGNPIGSDTPANIELKQPRFTNGVLVATLESNYPRFRQPDQAAQYASSAVGVAIVCAGKMVIVAKDEILNHWATSNVSGGSGYKTNAQTLSDMSGRQNTATIINTLSDVAESAYYCNGYYPTGVQQNDTYFGAGRWWLPSIGELFMIWSHIFEVDRLLLAIGGTRFSQTRYWSSTEKAVGTSYAVGFFSGCEIDYWGKTRNWETRPVSSFY